MCLPLSYNFINWWLCFLYVLALLHLFPRRIAKNKLFISQSFPLFCRIQKQLHGFQNKACALIWYYFPPRPHRYRQGQPARTEVRTLLWKSTSSITGFMIQTRRQPPPTTYSKLCWKLIRIKCRRQFKTPQIKRMAPKISLTRGTPRK